MINYVNVTSFCSEDLSLIENYQEAVNSPETYDCHHRRETDEGYSMQELIDLDLYYGRPANELIFLTHGEHTTLHNRCRQFSVEHRANLSKALKGRQLSKEHKAKISAGGKGLQRSAETRAKIAAARKGRTPCLGKHWYKDEITGKRIYY